MERVLKKIDKSLVIFAVLVFGFLFATSAISLPRVFATTDDETAIMNDAEAHHIVIYDGEEKLSIKSDAATVFEVLERAEIELGEADAVEPGLDAAINADNFYINIHRGRPVVVKDEVFEKLITTSSFDAETIATEAGLTIYDGDTVAMVPNTQFLELGAVSVYEVTRGEGATLTVTEEIPFAEETRKDYELETGKSEVIQLGEVGSRQLVYAVKTQNGVEISRELISETVTKEPVTRVTRVGADKIEMNPLTVSKGRNYYTATKADGTIVERQETYYDLNMSVVMSYCGKSGYTVRADGAKVDDEGYVLVAANLSRYPRCSVVQTSLGLGKVYDTGGFAASNPEQFDLATDWSDGNGI